MADLSSQERTEKMAELEKLATKNESLMPNIPLKAVCSGKFLSDRGYLNAGRDGLFKRESKGYYLFVAVPEVREETVTAAPLHPFYSLDAIS